MRSPAGFRPGVKSGYHDAILDHGVQKIKAENKDLKAQLAELQGKVDEIVNSLNSSSPKKGKANA